MLNVFEFLVGVIAIKFNGGYILFSRSCEKQTSIDCFVE